MDKLTQGYTALLTADGTASDKFWELEKRLKKDVRCVGVCADMRRSQLIWNLISLLNEGAIDYSDLDGFSDGLLEVLEAFTRNNR